MKKLLAILTMHSYNIKVVHWKAQGDRFDTIHKWCDKYHKMLCNDVDVVGEMLLRGEDSPCNYREVYTLLEEADGNYPMIDPQRSYLYTDFVDIVDLIFGNVLDAINEILDSEAITEPHNVGIKASLESMYDKYDLQKRYINKNRISSVTTEEL